jgi:dethiobiotin synthetase
LDKGYLIAGTDTGVGKTLVAAALIRKLVMSGLRCAGMKPVAAGCSEVGGRRINEDVELLRGQSNVDAGDAWMAPYAFRDPVAPHIAAEREGVRIERDRILEAFGQLKALADRVVVEGVGGFRVPLGQDWDTADLAVDLALPVILVVGLRLGCLNHALLTREAMAVRGLELAGWVGNCVDPGMDALRENIDFLGRSLEAPLLGTIPFMGEGNPPDAARRIRLPEHAIT